ncbi:MAG: glycosyltransferase family 4 protein [Candidatus Pacebacteria bacterium]|nr:glycosyltransferase family 4 protein [Candidatus Paceibacterota bacterium]
MNILIATGIYPPSIGGPAQYAKSLYETWSKQGHHVTVKTYNLEHKLPTGIRHLYFFFKILPAVMAADFILALDTFSVGFPAVLAGKILGVPVVIRTGGDFLWEGHVERTRQKILLKDFYSKPDLNVKEKIIFSLTRFTLRWASRVVFSTNWQKDIWEKPYSLDEKKVSIIENFYGPKISCETKNKTILGSTRSLVWKNLDSLPEGVVTKQMTYEEMMRAMSDCYAVILVSLGDVSPNMILDAIARNKPFILTKENGLTERIKDCAIFVDPKNPIEIEEKVNWLINNYDAQKKKVEAFTFTHSWEEIAQEFLKLI